MYLKFNDYLGFDVLSIVLFMSRMLSLHNDLMKKYQKEQRTNTAQVEKIATLSVCFLLCDMLANCELKVFNMVSFE